MSNLEKQNKNYSKLVSHISETFVQGRQRAVLSVNTCLVETYWQIGQYIVEYEQGGNVKAEYGKRLLEDLSKDLTALHGKGLGVSNLYRMRQFYQTFPILATVSQEFKEIEKGAEVPHQLENRILATPSQEFQKTDNQGVTTKSQEFNEVQKGAMPSHQLENRICATPSHKFQDAENQFVMVVSEKWRQLSWSHWVELLKIDDPMERSFYMNQTINECWSVAQLVRQKKTSLYLRLAASKDVEGILQLAQKGQLISKPEDIIREPYVVDFLNIPEPYQASENEIESRIISHLQQFLLEMGKGFAFVGRQYRIMLGNRPHRIDLVFYHYILKCFVLIDLKREAADYQDIGQMNMYLGYFEKEENNKGDNPPIGIVLAREKDEYEIEYALNNISSRLFVSKYQLYLPTKEQLKQIIENNS